MFNRPRQSQIIIRGGRTVNTPVFIKSSGSIGDIIIDDVRTDADIFLDNSGQIGKLNVTGVVQGRYASADEMVASLPGLPQAMGLSPDVPSDVLVRSIDLVREKGILAAEAPTRALGLHKWIVAGAPYASVLASLLTISKAIGNLG